MSAQGTNCGSADPFCTGTTYIFPNNTGVPDSGPMDCLGSSPNPAWYYLQIATPGDLDITINQTNTSGVGIDVDFDLWGPFTSTSAGCTSISSGTSSIDCSYSTAATEIANITGAATGEFYLLLLTNYSNQPGTITFSQTGGTGTTDCSVLCAPPNASAGSAQTLTCSVTSVSLSGNSTTSGVSYSWTGPGGFTSSLQNPTVTTAGTYTVTVSDPANAGCPSTATQIVNPAVGAPNATAGGPQTLTCTTSSVNLNGSSSTSGAMIAWTGPGGFSSSSGTPSVTTAGTYTLTVTDPGTGCTSTAIQVVSTNTTLPDATAGTVQSITCITTSATLTGTSTTSGATFSWSGPGGFSSTSASPAGVLSAGTYTVTITDPANGCTSTATQNVIINNTPPDANAGSAISLSCITTVNLTGSSSTSGATFSWSGPGGFASSLPTPNVTAAGTYTVTVTDPANGCTSTATQVVNPSAGAPDATAGTTMVLTCTASTVSLTGASLTTGVTYSWSGPGIVSGGTTATPTVNTAGVYTVTVTDPSNGCTSTATQTVNINTTPPLANGGSDQFLACTIPSLNLNGSGSAGVVYSWTGPGIVSGGTTTSPLVNQAGTYTLTVTDTANGCTSTDIVVVTGDVIPSASFTATPTTGMAPLSVNFTNTSTGAVSYFWDLGDGTNSTTADPSDIYSSYGNYNVILVATNSSGCSDTFSIMIHVDDISLLTIPNIFTPNGDGQNDVFHAITVKGITSFNAAIYDRWGLKLYEWANVAEGWNGQAKNGKPSPDGTYYYIISGEGIDGKKYQYNGYLQLLREK